MSKNSNNDTPDEIEFKMLEANVDGSDEVTFQLEDGSIIKSIAFNAKDSPLEPFLNKENKKNFSIAGKMNLNEWRGKKNVEFIIEDISLH